MTRDIDHAYDEAGQWTGPGRERYQIHYAGTGKAKGRKRTAGNPGMFSGR